MVNVSPPGVATFAGLSGDLDHATVSRRYRMTPGPDPGLLSTKEAAVYLNVSTQLLEL